MKKSSVKKIKEDLDNIQKRIAQEIEGVPTSYSEQIKLSYVKYGDESITEIEILNRFCKEKGLLDYYYSLLKSINSSFDKRLLKNNYFPIKLRKINNISINSAEDIIIIFLIAAQLILKKDEKYFCEFYTPENIAEQLVEQVSLKSLSKREILDPSCGIGTLLCSLVVRYSKKNSSDKIGELISNSIFGIDILPFSVLASKIQLYSIYSKISPEKANTIKTNIDLQDTLHYKPSKKYSLIIANPPYKKISEIPPIFEKYKGIIYGHPNLYSLFILWCLENLSEKGSMVFLIPEMIKTGKFNKRIREKLISECEIRSIVSFPGLRNVFHDAEQKVMIIHFSKFKKEKDIELTVYNRKNEKNKFKIDRNFFGSSGSIWLTPESEEAYNIIKKIKRKSNLFKKSRNFLIGNGSYVWNQKKNYLKDDGSLPVIYSNSVKESGIKFPINFNSEEKKEFSTERYEAKIFRGEKILVKRTTGSENSKKVVGCLLDNDFLNKYPEYYIENHVNFISPTTPKGKKQLSALSRYLNSYLLNFYFKSVASNQHISVHEMQELPLNENLISEMIKSNIISEEEMHNFFGLSEDESKYIKNSFLS